MSGVDFRVVKQLWMFLAVADERHFGRAAARLGMSQPPLTQQIKALEQSLGLTLFERSRQGTALSAAGLALVPIVRQFMGHVERLDVAVREVAAGQSGLLQIGAITSAMTETVPRFSTALRAQYPNLTILVREIDSADAIPTLLSGDLDLAFARLEGDIGADIATLPLAEERLAVAVPQDHRLASHARIPMKALQGEPLVVSSRNISPVYFDRLVSACRENDVTPRILHEVRSVSSQIAYVSCGQGVALVPASMGRLAPQNVRVRPLAETVTVVTAAAAWNRRRRHPIVDASIAWLEADRLRRVSERTERSGGRSQALTKRS